MPHLIIPDIHNRCDEVEALIKLRPGHRVIFLGDYFDQFHDTCVEASATAKWLSHSLQQPGRTHLMGNHDLPYRWSFNECPGWTKSKHKAVAKHMTPDLWSKCKVTTAIAGNPRPIVLSHAGITTSNLFGVGRRGVEAEGVYSHLAELPASEILREIGRMSKQVVAAASRCSTHHWLRRGSRMGEEAEGGPFWLDWDSFYPIEGIDQIVGHTPSHLPHYSVSVDADDDSATSHNVMIDGDGRYAAVVDDNGDVRVIHARGPEIGKTIEPRE